MTSKEQWDVWRAILDRIISSPHYRYDDPQKAPYLKLAAFATSELGRWNTLHWGPEVSQSFPRRFADAHLRRCPSLPVCIYGARLGGVYYE